VVNLLRFRRLWRVTLIHSAKAVSCILISARTLDGVDEGLRFLTWEMAAVMFFMGLSHWFVGVGLYGRRRGMLDALGL
jgi:hypothetical protein